MDYVLHLFAKAGLTVLLLWVAAMCGYEIYRLWCDKQVVMAPFTYVRDGAAASESGRQFVQRVAQDLRGLRRLMSPGAVGGDVVPSSDQRGRAQKFDLPETPDSLLTQLDIQAYGVQWGNVFRTLDRWVRRPREISGSVEDLGGKIDVTAELRQPGGAGGEPAVWHVRQQASVGEASFELACLIFQHAAARSDLRFAAGDEQNFVAFVRALRAYEAYRHLILRSAGKAETDAALAAASQRVTAVVGFPKTLPAGYKLAALIYRDQEKIPEAKQMLTKYLALLGEGETDKHAEEMLAALKRETTLEVAAGPGSVSRRGVVRPLEAGVSIGTDDGAASTLCCFVRDAAGVTYALAASEIFKPGRSVDVMQPAPLDGGTRANRIGVTDRAVPRSLTSPNRASGGLVRLEPDVAIRQHLVGFGPMKGIHAGPIEVGAKVVMAGRTSAVKHGLVRAIHADTAIGFEDGQAVFTGAILIDPISEPGDSGAPVLTEDGQLVGMVVAGSPEVTVVMPIRPTLEALGVMWVPAE